MRLSRAKVRKRLLKGLSIRYERIEPEDVIAWLAGLQDSTVVLLEKALFSHPQALRAIDARWLIRPDATEAEVREMAFFGDLLPTTLNTEQQLARVRELHAYDIPALRGTEDFTAASGHVQDLCRTLLAALGRLVLAVPMSGRGRPVFRTVRSRPGADAAIGIADPELLQLVLDYPDRIEEVAIHVEERGLASLGTVREQFENVAAPALGGGWI